VTAHGISRVRASASFLARLVPAVAVVVALPAVALAAGDGNEAKLFFYRVLNVVLLGAVLYVAARKPIQAFFRDRRDQIQGEVETAARLKKEAEQRHARLQRQLTELETELERIRHTARERAQRERVRILSDAQASAERIRQDARLAIEQELRRARAALRREASDLSVEIAADLLRDQVGSSDQERLIDEFIHDVGRASHGSGS
jgi:F-type H+-transporting ATPase subunit b